MKHLFTIFLLLTGLHCFANMASPRVNGTISGSPFTSRNVDILNEKIYVQLDSNYNSAFFKIEYRIKTDFDGIQIPLLFYAMNYASDFKVWLDNKPIPLSSPLPSNIDTSNSIFESFTKYFDQNHKITVNWENGIYHSYNYYDLLFFKTLLSKGEHTIRVEYTSKAWIHLRSWVQDYSVLYSLEPARYWKSFGTLEVTLDARMSKSTITTNFGLPTSGSLDSIAIWTFNELPSNYFQIDYVPEISKKATLLIQFGTTNMTICFAILIIILHITLIILFRKRKPYKKFSWVVIVGSIFLPLIVFLFNIYSYEIIFHAIGNQANHFYDFYSFLIIFWYPFIMPVYWVIMWLFDKLYKRRLIHNTQ